MRSFTSKMDVQGSAAETNRRKSTKVKVQGKTKQNNKMEKRLPISWRMSWSRLFDSQRNKYQ